MAFEVGSISRIFLLLLVCNGRSLVQAQSCADCSTDATCAGGLGIFSCTCNPGFTGDGFSCDPLVVYTEDGVQCVFPFNYLGTAYYQCITIDNDGVPWCSTRTEYHPSYWGNCDFDRVVEVDPCSDESLNNCSANAACGSDSGTISCTCNPGFTGDGLSCEPFIVYTVDGEQCAFPFNYNDETYYDCTTANNAGIPWCSTETEYDESSWANCNYDYEITVTECSGHVEVSGDSGVISTPNFPNDYPANHDCSVTVRIPEGQVIDVGYVAFDLEPSNTCGSFDSLKVYDGALTDGISPYQTACGSLGSSEAPTNFTSSTNLVTFLFRSDSSRHGSGFLVRWQRSLGCNDGIVTGTSGVIISPNYPSAFQPNQDCTWNFTVPDNKVLEVHFEDFDVSDGFDRPHFCLSYVDITIGGEPYGGRGRFCTPLRRPGNFSTVEDVSVRFVSHDRTLFYRGFLLRWQLVDDCAEGQHRCWSGNCIAGERRCDGVVDCSDKSDEVECSRESSDETECGKNVVAPEFNWDQRIVGGSEAANGSWPWQVVVSPSGGLCGGSIYSTRWILTAAHCVESSSPGNVVVTVGAHAYSGEGTEHAIKRIEIHRNYYDVEGGYDIALLETEKEIVYSDTVRPICIAAPGDEFSTCVATGWGTLHADGPLPDFLHQVRLPLVDFETCQKAYPELEVGRVCAGNYAAGTIDTCQGDSGGPLQCLLNSTWHLLGIVSYGDSCAQPGKPGVYTDVRIYNNWIKEVLEKEPEDDRACSGGVILNGTSGVISSPGFPGSYPDEASCTWDIVVPVHQVVTLSVLSFSVEGSSSGCYDEVDYYDGPFLLGTFCDGSPPPDRFTSFSNNVRIGFFSDVTERQQGFQIIWNATDVADDEEACQSGGVRLNGTSGSILSPGFPSTYDADQSCVWFIDVPTDQVIELTFQVVDLESSMFSGCVDSLTVLDGHATTVYCTSNPPPPTYFTTSNSVVLLFRSDSAVHQNGFQIQWNAIDLAGDEACRSGGVRLNGTSGTVLSPGFPNTYGPGLSCSWFIDVPTDHVIELTFQVVDLEGSTLSGCADTLTVLDGLAANVYCTSNPPPLTYFTASNSVELRFSSNFLVQLNGFQIHWNAIGVSDNDAACSGGNVLRGESGLISSPNFPNTYDNDLTCSWHISVRPNQVVELVVFLFDVESGEGRCESDSLTVTDGQNLVGSHCNGFPLTNYNSATNNVTLTFSSDGSVTLQGFQIKWTAITPSNNDFACSGGIVLRGESGLISSPNFPNAYDNDLACSWHISVRPNQVVELIVLSFDIELGLDYCEYDSLTVTDGANLVGSYCNVNPLTNYNSTTNNVTLAFVSDGSKTFQGFQIEWTAIRSRRFSRADLARVAYVIGVNTNPIPRLLSFWWQAILKQNHEDRGEEWQPNHSFLINDAIRARSRDIRERKFIMRR